MTIGNYGIEEDSLYLVGDALIDDKGLVDHHLSSVNDFLGIGIEQIVTQVFEINMTLNDIKRTTDDEKNIDHLDVLVKFTDINISRPTMINYNSGKEEVLFPNMALMKEKTYKSTLRVGVKITVTAVLKNGFTIVKEDMVKNFKICEMPIMVKSKWCNTYGLSKESLVNLHEDPSDPGGYFIIKGIEWTIDCVENILFNKIRIFKNEGYKKEIMRAEFIAKPGDYYLNSDQFIVRWMNDGRITVEIRREKLKEIQIPIYLIFRMLGWNTDKQIFDNVLFGYDTPTSKNMIRYLIGAFDGKYTNLGGCRNIYTQHDALQYMAEEIKDTAFAYLDLVANPEGYQRITNFILDNFDTHFMQHMGNEPIHRDNKLRFLCVIIRKMFLVQLGNMEVTDRDSYNSKRIHAAGTSYAKTFKTNFNASIVQQMRRKITKNLKDLSFNQIDLVNMIKTGVFGKDFERSITQSITAGNKSQVSINNRARINRLSSQLLNRKNQLNVYSTLRQVTATTSDNSKQSERASEMRRVHMSFLGYICVTHSPEGEKVGINKQLAIFATITKAQSGEAIKSILLEDKSIYPLESISFMDIENRGLCNIYVNGNWIGCCDDALQIATKYRKLRRRYDLGIISGETTIVWDNTQDEVYFWTDVGRVIRPLLIVYNNTRDFDHFDYSNSIGSAKIKKQEPQVKKETQVKKSFFQGLAITEEHIQGLYAKTLGFEDLIAAGVVEYISAEEQENMYLAPSFDVLREDAYNELHEYTHCDIPQSMFGVTALTSPYADHNQAQRIVYQTSQSKQTCGLFAKNWPYRADKDTFLQYNNEVPVVKTASNHYLYPNGSNCIVAIMSNTGYNIEDSIVINQGAIDRGLFNGSKFTNYATQIEQREEFATPDVTNCTDIKSANYDKLINGIIKVGTIVNKNDALIGKIIKITKNIDDNFQYADRSVIYKDDEQCIVYNVIVDRNEEDERFCKVVLRKLRPVMNGDKFCVTKSHEVLTTSGWKFINKITLNDTVATLNKDTHVIEWHKPTEIHEFDHDDDMYYISNHDVDLVTTLNHKMYARDDKISNYDLIEAQNLAGKKYYLKKNGVNIIEDIAEFELPEFEQHKSKKLNMNDWLEFLGIYLIKGYCGHINDQVIISDQYQHNENRLDKILPNTQLHNYLKQFGQTDVRYVPIWALTLSKKQSEILLDAILGSDYNMCYTKSKQLVDDIQILAINSHKCAGIDKFFNTEFYGVYISDLEVSMGPSVNDPIYREKNYETIKPFKGSVYCITVPNNVFMVRHSDKYVWTGNSSRSGQKSTVGLALRDSDMPSTVDGVKPSIIINPHAIPSRMTIGQLIESQVSTLCAAKCSTIDATIFKKVDIKEIGDELEKMGLNRNGYSRLYNGITGEYIDCEIFIGPTFYQRLMKFTIDTIYSVNQGPSDAITYQPLDGKNSRGGLRIGEMERDVICAHGASKFLAEKYFSHSDGYTEYVCRCGKTMAAVNIEKGIYKCNYCKDFAQTAAFNTSWSSKLFMMELESMNVGIKRMSEPFTYNKSDDKIFEIIEDGRSGEKKY
jgi:DNA-directed RNA polymerase beta subunit